MMGADSPPTPPAGPLLSEESATLLRELGDYFTRTAQIWSSLTHSLLQDPHVCQVAIDVNNRSAKQTSLTVFTTVSAVDVTISRFRYVSQLIAPHGHLWHASHTVTQENTRPSGQVLSRRPGCLAAQWRCFGTFFLVEFGYTVGKNGGVEPKLDCTLEWLTREDGDAAKRVLDEGVTVPSRLHA
ncbi:uncharacterized protein BBA_09565 [Beauveria bassiana ARSEF 2860]|uniref:Uncharacterized protein n=1 Tax=Beauveria bassiana (strain ARSEF 2860) TaxID=655819 RepID=J5JC55_BEAB2|nr:uncharacterized protein BBA_09565 [Beauveria bassiana ARSEF 2860]EJP61486.1 hypothetical protein BBA_09565 [Beauveria bassiana ARSEF 2860]